MEESINEKYSFLNQQATKIEEMIQSYNTMIAKIQVFRNAAMLFNIDKEQYRRSDSETDPTKEPLLGAVDDRSVRVSYIGGSL